MPYSSELIQCLMAAAGALGFSILFNIRGYKLIFAAVGGGIGWAFYLFMMAGGQGIFMSYLLATILVALMSELMARLLKTPVIIILVPMLIPMIPGSDLYRMMSLLVRGSWKACLHRAQILSLETTAISLGIILTASLMNIIRSFIRIKSKKQDKAA